MFAYPKFSNLSYPVLSRQVTKHVLEWVDSRLDDVDI